MAEETGSSAEEVIYHEPPTYDEFIEFLQAKNIARDCERCGSKHWYVETINDDRTPAMAYAEAKPYGLLKATRAVSITVCSNCGNIRMFLVAVIRNWLDTRKSKDAAPEVNDG